jgi:hypothetical protein
MLGSSQTHLPVFGEQALQSSSPVQRLISNSPTHGEQACPAYLVAAIDPVNFEKLYTKKLEGVSTVYKKKPPNLTGEARLARGYPAITATVVNTPEPAISYTNWFSYPTVDFFRVRLPDTHQELWVLVKAVLWLRKLGGKLGLPTDRDGPYIVLRGLGAVWQTVAALSWTAIQPFPHQLFQDT